MKKNVDCVIKLNDGREMCYPFEKVGTVNGCEAVTIEHKGFAFGVFEFASEHCLGCKFDDELDITVLSIPVYRIAEMYLVHGRVDRRRHGRA